MLCDNKKCDRCLIRAYKWIEECNKIVTVRLKGW